MARLVLTHRAASGYDDVPEERYHFPRTYLRTVERGVGDFFLYYEPRREGGREAYVAWGRLGEVTADPHTPDHFYAWVSRYQGFPRAVPFREGHERAVHKADGTANRGAFGRSVREIPPAEFDAILAAGFAPALAAEGDSQASASPLVGGEPEVSLSVDRPMVERVVSQPVRDRAFADQVRVAYDSTCAFTGLRVTNGGGWAEVEAAHIKPVHCAGPDSVRNGLALSRTVHALFDRGFLSLTDRYEILESRRAPLPEPLRLLLPPTRTARVPDDPHQRPHAHFLDFHRRRVFKDAA